MSDDSSQELFDASDEEGNENNSEALVKKKVDNDQKRGRRSKHGIEYPEDGICPYCKKEKSKANWSRHLSLVHADEVRKAEEAQSSQPKQQLLDFPVVHSQGRANRLLALYAGSSTMPLQHVDSNRFLGALLAMVPKLKVPDRRALGRQIDGEVNSLQSTIAKYLSDSKYHYSFGPDISTTKGMMLSLLGITVHVFASNGTCVRAFALELIEMEEKHTAAYVKRLFEGVLAKHKLSEQKTIRIVTDCGSNMISAFFEPYRVVDEEADQEDDELEFVERDEEAMDAIAAGFEPEEAEDVAAAFDGVHKSANGHQTDCEVARHDERVVCYDHNIDEISTEDFRRIDSLLKITDPFRGFSKKLQQESVPTISLLFAGIKGLLDTLQGLKDQDALSDICDALQSQLRERFSDVLDSGESGRDPIYLAAACLDPSAAQHSNVFELYYIQAISAIKEMGRLLIADYGNGIEVEETPSASKCDDVFGFNLPVKKPRLDTSNTPDKLTVELEEYRAILRRRVTISTADFWKLNEHKLRYLTQIARNILAVPAASSAVERLFSQTTLHSSGHKGRSKYKIRRKALLSFNDAYIKI